MLGTEFEHPGSSRGEAASVVPGALCLAIPICGTSEAVRKSARELSVFLKASTCHAYVMLVVSPGGVDEQ